MALHCRRGGVDGLWSEDVDGMVAVQPDTLVYFVFEGMPMGWSWALYFCQSSLSAAAEVACPQSGTGAGGLLEDATVAPIVEKGWPVAAVYVDNALVVGHDYDDTARALSALRKVLDIMQLVYHEIVEPCKGLVFVGMWLDLQTRELRTHRKENFEVVLCVAGLVSPPALYELDA